MRGASAGGLGSQTTANDVWMERARALAPGAGCPMQDTSRRAALAAAAGRRLRKALLLAVAQGTARRQLRTGAPRARQRRRRRRGALTWAAEQIHFSPFSGSTSVRSYDPLAGVW